VRSLKFEVRGILLQFMWCIESPYVFAYSHALRRLCSAKSIDSRIGLQPTYMGYPWFTAEVRFPHKALSKSDVRLWYATVIEYRYEIKQLFFPPAVPSYKRQTCGFAVFSFFYVFVPSDVRF